MRLIVCAGAMFLSVAACGEPQRLGTNVHFACDTPAVDTTGWRRVPGPYPGYTVLAPPTLQAQASEGADALLGDGARRVRIFRRPWGAAQFQNANMRHADYNSCWTRIAEMRTYVVVRRIDGGYQVTGWYRRPTTLPADAGIHDGILSGASAEPADQAIFLRMIRSLAATPP